MSVVTDLYDTVNELAKNRLTYKKGVESCNTGDILYGFSYNVSSNSRSLQLGSQIVQLKVIEKIIQNSSYTVKYAHRVKRDGTLFLNPSHIYRYCMFRSKAEAEEAYKALSVFFRQEINKEIDKLSALSEKFSKIV